MNERTAKELRKKVYGSGSKRNLKEYKRTPKGELVTQGKRAEYLKLKRELKK